MLFKLYKYTTIYDFNSTQTKFINAINDQGKTFKLLTKKIKNLNTKFNDFETKLFRIEIENS